ncbi:MAG: DUF5677 domain-containing protein [Proteiniphilum sp.]
MIDDKVNRILQELVDNGTEVNPEKLDSVLREMISEGAIRALQLIKEENRDALAYEANERLAFEEQNYALWKEPLDLLQLFLLTTTGIGGEFNHKYRPEAAENNDFVFEVLTRLHGRACQVGNEILILLKSGYADGANARWRTLHEITVTSYFIKENGSEMAERYLLYDYIESYRSISDYVHNTELYERHKAVLGDALPSQAEMMGIEETKNELCARFGKGFSKEYGWVAGGTKKITFKDLESEVGIDHLRPYYKMANISIHAGPKGVRFSLGSPSNDIIPAGASNMGLADPGMSTVISLQNMNAALLSTRPDVGHLITLKAMSLLADEVKDAFYRCHKETWAEYERRKRLQEPD